MGISRAQVAVMAILASCASAAAGGGQDYPVAPVSFEKVKLADTFWLPRLVRQAQVTVPHALKQAEPAIEDLRRCGNIIHGRGGPKPSSHRWLSSDLFKIMEGAAYLLAIQPDPALEARMDELIAIIADAQQPDGYLYVAHAAGVPSPEEMGERPYSYVVHSHELYNVGHMYEGAVAYFAATGKDNWLKVAEKSATHVNKAFFEGDPNYNGGKPVNQAPGHQEIELGLCKLYRATGKPLYLEMAKRFLDIRGVTFRPDRKGVNSPTYAQQHKPVREQDEPVGHSVRAGYMYAGMADVGALAGDRTLLPALDRIWHSIVDTRMHITGGLGAVHGIEGFGLPYELPNKEAYNETCAAVANVFFNFRMCLLHQDARYFDVAEVALLNNALAGVSLAGDRFFYVNPLEADGQGKSGERADWFGCACCPSNIARLIPQVSGYMYAHSEDSVYLLLYGSSSTTVPLAGGAVGFRQETDYPFGGLVKLTVEPKDAREFALRLRIPTWAGTQFVPGALYRYSEPAGEKWSVKVNGEAVEAVVDKGFATLRRTWKPGDRVELNLPMPVHFSIADQRVEADRGRAAVTRGPLVYCAEQADNPDVQPGFRLTAARTAKGPAAQAIADGPLKGIPQITLPVEGQAKPVRLIPYYAWANRGQGWMTVWIAADGIGAAAHTQ